MKTIGTMIALGLFWSCLSGPAFCQAVNGLKIDEKSRVSLRVQEVSLKAFLNELAQEADIEIFLTDTLKDGKKTIGFDNAPLHQVLEDLLKKTNFALIYGSAPGQVTYIIDPPSPSSSKQRLKSTGDSDPLASLASQHFNANSPKKLSARDRRVVKLERQIQRLEGDIESGEAQKRYEYWIQRKDPKYVITPQDQLKNYRQRLAKLKSN